MDVARAKYRLNLLEQLKIGKELTLKGLLEDFRGAQDKGGLDEYRIKDSFHLLHTLIRQADQGVVAQAATPQPPA